MSIIRFVCVLAMAGCEGTSPPPAPAAAPAKAVASTREPIYDESADAKATVAAAVAKAKKENKRVLVKWGANWCGWCFLLHDVFEQDRAIARLLLYEYELVSVDVGRFDKNMALADRLGAKLRGNGIPYLTVLDDEGKPIANQDTGSLEDGPKHDPAKVKEFLVKFQAPPQDAENRLRTALKAAKAGKKMLFVGFVAPWCVWCHRLDDFLAQERIATIIRKDFVLLKIDVDRMTHGKEVAERLRRSEGGVPWFAFIRPDGEIVATADGPNGNVGFPVATHEIGHFMAILKKHAERITPTEMAEIDTAFQMSAKSIIAQRAG